MPVPTYDKFIEPILRYLAARPGGAAAKHVHDAAAAALNLSSVERQELLPSGVQPVYKNRAGWAHDRLKRAGLSSGPRRGFWQLTPKGMEFANSGPEPLSAKNLSVNSYTIAPSRNEGGAGARPWQNELNLGW